MSRNEIYLSFCLRVLNWRYWNIQPNKEVHFFVYTGGPFEVSLLILTQETFAYKLRAAKQDFNLLHIFVNVSCTIVSLDFFKISF